LNSRQAQIEAFLDKAGWGRAARAPITGDASFRRYERLTNGKGVTAVLMDAPPPQENVHPFVSLTRHLISLGLSAPRIHESDEGAGLLLLEDFGSANMAALVDRRGPEEKLYALAVDTLLALHGHPRAIAAPAPPFGEERLLREVGLALEWYLPAISRRPTPESLRAEYLDVWRRVLPVAKSVPDTLVLFDFFPDNLMLLENRAGIAGCGLLDFQDAVIGPLTYDLVSLLEDARREVPAPVEDAMLERYLRAFPSLDRTAFAASYAVMGAQRNMRIIGVFTRLCVRDRKAGYLRHIPRVWRHVERSLEHRALQPLKRWLDLNIPPEMRRIPPCENAQ